MPTDEDTLEKLNVDLGKAESAGEHKALAAMLAPELAFLRADGSTVDDAGRFLQKVKQGPDRTTVVVKPIEVLGNRAIVRCVVTMNGKSYHNLRLWVRIGGAWRLLGWANEPEIG